MLKLEDIYGALPSYRWHEFHANIEADVTVAKDGQEAFELVKESMEQQKLFNLIFMDIQVSHNFSKVPGAHSFIHSS